MARTYTTQFFDVSDGDTTTHNPQELAPTTVAIRVLDAEIQWEGVTTSSTSTSTRSNTNSDTATATTRTTRTTSSNTNSDSATASVVTDTKIETTIAVGDDNAEASVPSGPSGYTLQSVDVQYEARRKFAGSSTETIVYNTADGNNVVQQELDSFFSTIDNVINDTTPRGSYAIGKTTFGNETEFRATVEATFVKQNIVPRTASVDPPSVPNGFNLDRYVLREYENGNRVKKQTFFSNLATQTRTSTDPATTVEVEIETIGEDFNTVTNNRTASVSYPSVPSGTTFDRHIVEKFEDGSRVNTTQYFSQQSGSESITSSSPSETVEVEITTIGEDISSTPEDTRNPSVSGDVSASYTNGDIGDGNTTSFISLSGLTADPETFSHSIGGSGEARFRFRFDFEEILPDPTNGTVAFADTSAGVFREAVVADPSDPGLRYNHVQIYNASTGNWGALDVVPLTDEDAIEQFAFYDTDAGWLAPREQSTTPI